MCKNRQRNAFKVKTFLFKFITGFAERGERERVGEREKIQKCKEDCMVCV